MESKKTQSSKCKTQSQNLKLKTFFQEFIRLENFAFGGWREQKRRLEGEGVEIKGDKVDLGRYLCHTDIPMRAHVFISGRVQGVFFRAYTQSQAQKLGLKGWVKNTADGRVEAVFEGPEDKLKKMIGWCRQGSPASQVEKVEVLWEEPEGFEEFEIKY